MAWLPMPSPPAPGLCVIVGPPLLASSPRFNSIAVTSNRSVDWSKPQLLPGDSML